MDDEPTQVEQAEQHVLQLFAEASRINKALRDRSGKDRTRQQELLQNMMYVQANGHPATAAFLALGEDEAFRGAMSTLIGAALPDLMIKDPEKTHALIRCVTALVIAGMDD